MVDHALIQRKIAMLLERKQTLIQYKLKNYKAFSQSPYPKAVEKLLQEMVEICLDIGKHIIADMKWEIASESRDVFSILHAHNILSKPMLLKLHKMVGFRNLIIHLYDAIDNTIVYEIYKSHLGDFNQFAKTIDTFISRN